MLRNEIIRCLALVEALIDFGEGEDIEEGVYDRGSSTLEGHEYITYSFVARQRVLRLRDTIQHHLSDNRRGEIMRSGIRLAIFGPPNAGKSTLLNFLGLWTPNLLLP